MGKLLKMKIDTVIQGYYENKIETEQDLIDELTNLPKRELIDFILHHQERGTFSDIQNAANHNEEFIKLFGRVE